MPANPQFPGPRIGRPAYPGTYIDRPRLYQQLDFWQEKRAIVIHAPSGYGKSSLVSRWLDLHGHAADAAWLALDDEDVDPRRFLLRFVAGESLTEFSNLSFPVSGRLFAGVFRADEVGLAGPTPGAEQLDTIEADLALDAIPSEIIHETVELPAGSYKVTAYLDLDFVPGEASMVASGDPAVLPFMGTELRCDKQLNVVEFGLTVP